MAPPERVSSDPLVTVLLPAYNPGRDFLERATRSALEQTYEHLEVLVVDDGSTDGSVDLMAQTIQDPRLRMLRKANGGLADALNHGLAEARGELICRLDADDAAKPDRVALQANHLRGHNDVGLVGGQMRRISAGRGLSTSRFPLDHPSIMRGLCRRAHVLSHPAVMFRAAAAREVGGYWTHGVSEDWDFFLRLGEVTKLNNLPNVVIDYTFHDQSINAKSMIHVRENMRLAVANHQRRSSGLPEMTPEEHRTSMNVLERLACGREASSLKHYREYLRASADRRSLGAGMHLATSAVLWPGQALRRLMAR